MKKTMKIACAVIALVAALFITSCKKEGETGPQGPAGTNGVDGDNQWSAVGNNIYNNNTGYVGIGTSSPKAPLHVVGLSTNINPMSMRYFSNYIDLTQTNWGGPCAALFEGDVIVAGSFIATAGVPAFSDARFKNIICKSNSANDLSVLNKIEITDFTFVDKVALGNKVQKKVVAQQVEEVFPNAIGTTTAYIPNIYSVANEVKSVNGNLQITMLKPHGLAICDKVKWIDQNGKTHYNEVKALPSDFCFELDASDNVNKVFVYGKETDDFRTVDYDAIAMLNVSATQELFKQIETLKADNAKLKTQLETENASIKASIEKIEAQFGINAQSSK